MRKPIQLSPLSPSHIAELHTLYRTTADVQRTKRKVFECADAHHKQIGFIPCLLSDQRSLLRNDEPIAEIKALLTAQPAELLVPTS